MMMMMGDQLRSNPTVQIPPWDYHNAEDPTAHAHCERAMAALQRYLPSNRDDDGDTAAGDAADEFDVPADAFSCDEFRMFEFKVRPCAVARSHDWTECPFAHPGEKARRRDPRRHRYSGDACPDFRRGECRRGDACEHAHGVFEAWLHPARYRTQPCKDGTHCRRRVCFFAHTPGQLRLLPRSHGSPELSPPVSPGGSAGWDSVSQLAESMRGLQLSKMRLGLGGGMSLCGSPPSWAGLGIGSPRSPPVIRPGFMSLPSTPIRVRGQGRVGASPFDAWGASLEEEPVMERVESGKELREKIYAKIGKENSLERAERVDPTGNAGPDLEWVSELVEW
ncbi:Zinc finger CCCH domain-containing protein 20 [Striga hermonthica]|uniref:Zinc finger CCCH domain-containing protein 20 n=1 Tax=Striga hermonthica TaxID=68872 RepID=A0A9N7MWV5_STRHE|nr:Zinc finger CCCH domain-containing protein 20 [Striga hermonthica]